MCFNQESSTKSANSGVIGATQWQFKFAGFYPSQVIFPSLFFSFCSFSASASVSASLSPLPSPSATSSAYVYLNFEKYSISAIE